MFLTNLLLKKVKAKSIMVLMESAVSGHKYNATRLRLGEKLEAMHYDPYNEERLHQKDKSRHYAVMVRLKTVRMPAYYKEKKKIKSIR